MANTFFQPSELSRVEELTFEYFTAEDIEMSLVPARFGMGVWDVLERTSGAPEGVEALEPDQIEDYAIYTGLKRAAEFERHLRERVWS